jgi:hypothetical protein
VGAQARQLHLRVGSGHSSCGFSIAKRHIGPGLEVPEQSVRQGDG